MRSRFALRGLPLLAAALSVGAGCAPAPGAGPVLASPTSTPATSAAPSTAPSATPDASVAPTTAPQAGTFALTGAVIDINRDPIAGATVTARQGDAEVGKATTGADGTYSLALPAGSYVVTAGKAGLTTRSQDVTLRAAQVLHFGPTAEDQANPFFLADTPEVEHVDVEETAAGGAVTLRVRLSEPLPTDAQENFTRFFQFLSGRTTEFLTPKTSGRRLTATSAWEDDGRTFAFSYPGPYLASGVADVEYTIKLDQDVRDTRDEVTREFEYQDLGIGDEAGNAIGRGRADYAFIKPTIQPPTLEMLTDPVIGYYVQDRRWRLTHADGFTFKARRDETPPVLERVEVKVDTQEGDIRADVLSLYFSEPMSVARDREELDWTRLDVDKEFVVLNVSTQAGATSFSPLSRANRMQRLSFDRTDPRIVRVEYARGTFKDQRTVEVTLTPDAEDPAGNKPDPAKNRLTGSVVGG